MEFQVTGKVVAITDDKVINDKLTTKQIVVEWFKEFNGKEYARKTSFELKKTDNFDSIKKLNGVNVGDKVTVKYNEPESREYKGQWYTKVEAWGVFKENAGGGSSSNDDSSLPF